MFLSLKDSGFTPAQKERLSRILGKAGLVIIGAVIFALSVKGKTSIPVVIFAVITAFLFLTISFSLSKEK